MKTSIMKGGGAERVRDGRERQIVGENAEKTSEGRERDLRQTRPSIHNQR